MKNAWDNLYKNGKQLNIYPYPEIVRFLKNIHDNSKGKNLSALDLGTGSGVHLGLLESLGFKSTGIDNSKEAIEFAQKKFSSKFSRLICGDLSEIHLHIKKQKFDIIVDRLSSTHTTKKIINNIYFNPELILNPNGKVLWSGFESKNDHRTFSLCKNNNVFSNFSDGKFKELGQACFFSIDEVKEIFKKYNITRLDCINVKDTITGYNDSHWLLEATYNG